MFILLLLYQFQSMLVQYNDLIFGKLQNLRSLLKWTSFEIERRRRLKMRQWILIMKSTDEFEVRKPKQIRGEIQSTNPFFALNNLLTLNILICEENASLCCMPIYGQLFVSFEMSVHKEKINWKHYACNRQVFVLKNEKGKKTGSSTVICHKSNLSFIADVNRSIPMYWFAILLNIKWAMNNKNCIFWPHTIFTLQ